MTTLLLGKIINFENSVNDGGIPCTLLSEKQSKSSAKSIYVNHFRRAQLLICIKFTMLSKFDYHSHAKPLKAISITTS